MITFDNIIFFKSIFNIEDCPNDEKKEILLLGRSNVGKSTIINSLSNKKISFSSKTPGCTKMINYFIYKTNTYIVDLPGYGFTKKDYFFTQNNILLIINYIKFRMHKIKLLILIIDIRRNLEKSEINILKLIKLFNIQTLIILNKEDKRSINSNNKKKFFIINQIKQCNVDNITNIITSSKKYEHIKIKKYLYGIKD